jgi:hypothetical protein
MWPFTSQEVKENNVEVTLRLTVGQSVFHVSSPLWDLWPEITRTFCPKVVVWKLLSCLRGPPSPTRGLWSSGHGSWRQIQRPGFDSRSYQTFSEVVGLERGLLSLASFLDRSRCFFFQVAPHLHSRGLVDSVPDSLLLRKSGSAGNRTRASGSVARNHDTRSQRRSLWMCW